MIQLQLLSWSEIENIYHKHLVHDFPPQETKPLGSILKMFKEDSYFGYGMYEDNRLLAYAFFVSVPAPSSDSRSLRAYLLLDYLAVVPDIRGTGIGSKTLSMLKELLPEQSLVLIEAENPEAAADTAELHVRQSRLRFYLNNRCLLSSVTTTVYGVNYVIFLLGTENLSDDACTHDTYIRNVLETIYGYMFSSHDVWKITGML